MYTIIISSLLYLGAYIYPDYLYLGVFLWIVPLLITDDDNRYGFKAGYTWGILFFGGHLAWLAWIVYAQGQGCVRMFLYFAAVAYFSMFSGFWLWFKQLLVYRYVQGIQNLNRKCVASCCTWVISTVTFICLTSYCSLAIFGCFEGYPFLNPLLPLVSLHWCMQAIIYFGTIPCWILIVFCNLSIATLYKRPIINGLIFAVLIICSQSMISLFIKNKNVKKIVKNNQIFYLQPTWVNLHLTPSQTFYEIGRCLDHIAVNNPEMKFVVIPESGFPYNLMEFENKLDAWTSLFEDATIFIGGHRHEYEKIYNTLYQISDGNIVAWYDKTHLVPFVERIPYWMQSIPIFRNVFMNDSHTFSYPAHDQSELTMAGFRPCICSELFFNRTLLTKHPILFICNDSWLALDYARDLAKRSARLYSLQYRVPIVYVGWYDAEVL